MAILTFQKPDKVIMNEADDFHGIFEFRPLQQGFGVTVGILYSTGKFDYPMTVLHCLNYCSLFLGLEIW